MKSYSSEAIPRPVTPDEFAEDKAKILDKHQKELGLLQESIAPLKAQAAQIKTDTEILIKEQQATVDVTLAESKKHLTDINETIQLKHDDLAGVLDLIRARQLEFEDILVGLDKQRHELGEALQAVTEREKEALNGKETNKKEIKVVLSKQAKVAKERVQFEQEKQEDTDALANRQSVLDTKENMLDQREVNLNAQDTRVQAATKDYLKLKDIALAVIEVSKINKDKRAAFEKAQRILEILIGKSKNLHIELAEKETRLNTKSGALAYRESNVRKREKLVRQAEKHIADINKKEAENGSSSSDSGS